MEMHYLSLKEVAALIEAKKVSPVEVVEAMLGRIDALNPILSPYYTVFRTDAIAGARRAEGEVMGGNYRGQLHGVPIGIKDIIAYGPTTAGSELRRRFIAEHTANSVNRLLGAGAIVLGKLATNEFALGAVSLDHAFPPARNPWRRELNPGGSSSGAGAALSAGMAYGAVGSDTGGSIRIPASRCGIVGLKPTYGLVSRQGVFPLSWSLDHVGPLTRRVADARIMLDALSPSTRDARNAEVPTNLIGTKVCIPWGYFQDNCDPEILAAFNGAVAHMRELGALVSEVDLGVSLIEVNAAFWLIMLPEAASYHARDLRQNEQQYGREFRLMLKAGALLNASMYLRAQMARRAITQKVNACWDKCDVLMLPTVGYPPERIPPHPLPITSRLKPRPTALYTSVFNLSGTPAISVPCGFDAGDVPIGLQFASRASDEISILRIAEAHESTTPWKNRHPQL